MELPSPEKCGSLDIDTLLLEIEEGREKLQKTKSAWAERSLQGPGIQVGFDEREALNEILKQFEFQIFAVEKSSNCYIVIFKDTASALKARKIITELRR